LPTITREGAILRLRKTPSWRMQRAGSAISEERMSEGLQVSTDAF
jgi:hypothetical protein